MFKNIHIERCFLSHIFLHNIFITEAGKPVKASFTDSASAVPGAAKPNKNKSSGVTKPPMVTLQTPGHHKAKTATWAYITWAVIGGITFSLIVFLLCR